MPKVSRKDNDGLLQEVLAVPMEADNTLLDPVAPSKPQFAPLSAYEQSGKKLEFRRVCSNPSLDRSLQQLVQTSHLQLIGLRRSTCHSTE